ncbi:MAG: 3-hydroxyacyl-CoA dehydrogenase/enoyl-CoA hydratase family protein [Flavobacteriales bacterium]|nr:3-hydroxyacyl-CoA dehydrogenase/enoyl-CoA hydratase family protein [Flavobacteriales bacterium]
MAFEYKNLKIEKLTVIGAGQIGPDICLHFAKTFWKDKVEFVLVDVSQDALDTAKAKIEKKIAYGEESGAFKPDMAEMMRKSILYTTDYSNVAGTNLVVEAATEDGNIKDIIFKQVEKLTDDACIYLSNSSHMQPEVIFRNIENKGRCLVAHYFFPAERNPVVELVPGKETDKQITADLMGFYETIGKIPIEVGSSYGYAIDPIFEGLCELAILCLEKGYGSVKEIDAIAQKTLKQGVGPFTALNLTGGNPITNHGLEEMRKTHIHWFRSPKTLQEMVAQKGKWETAKRGEEVEVDPEKAEVLRKQFLGGYFALCSYIIDLGITNVNDLDMATEIALVIGAPFTMMNRIGIDKAHFLVREWCAEHTSFPFPKSLNNAMLNGGWKVSRIVCRKVKGIAVLTIRRPKVLNALNLGVLTELKEAIEKAENDRTVQGIVITGFGTKAFVSGADINMLAALKTPEEGYENSHTFQELINSIEKCKKPTVCALNGFAFGGGNELAITCTARIAKKGLPVVACQPEANLGFIPGSGGTQRLPRLVGVDIAAEILRTARPVSSKEALEIGLIDCEAENDLIEEAVDFANKLVSGEAQPREFMKGGSDAKLTPKAVNIGHLSKKIDDIMNRAIYEGIKLPLPEALELEAKLFGECILSEDMRIGLENFKKNGPRAKAEFVHR